jgi:hypothetical protein
LPPTLRRLGDAVGVRNGGIALDVGLLLYERVEAGLSVPQISAATRHSGPTVRLVLSRLVQSKADHLRDAARRGGP